MAAQPNLFYPTVVGLASWCVPGAGHLILGERTRGIIIFVAVTSLFAGGLYIGSIGAINPQGTESWWYVGQMLASPVVSLLAKMNPSVGGVSAYTSYGKPFEVGQIYTTIAGLLNLLCVVNAVYMAYSGRQQPPEND